MAQCGKRSMCRNTGDCKGCQCDTDIIDCFFSTTNRSFMERFLQRRHFVPESVFRAADAAMPGHDRPGDCLIEP